MMKANPEMHPAPWAVALPNLTHAKFGRKNKNMNYIQNHPSRAAALLRSLRLLLLPLALAAGSLDAATPTKNVLRIYGTTVTEGNDGIHYADVTVTLGGPSSKSVSVNYRTIDGTATAGSDYDAVSGTLIFTKGQGSKTIRVPVRGDRTGEWDYYGGGSEYLVVELSNPTGGAKLDYYSTAYVYILDDEPTLSASGAYQYEGNSGTTPFTFSVSLSAASEDAVTIDFATQDYTAFAGVDYVAASGTLTFAPGETSKTITVDVIGNTVAEPDKSFFLNLSGAPSSVSLTSNSVYGTIGDDDGYYDDYYYYDPGYGYGWGYYYEYGYFY